MTARPMFLAGRPIRGAALLAALALLTACGDHSVVSPVEAPTFQIVDAAHGGSIDGFYFLPPLVPDPDVAGVFEPELASRLDVVVCVVSGTACAAELVVFQGGDQGGSEVIRVGDDSEHYIVNWHTSDFDLDPATTYRIEVRLDDSVLGYADVDVVESGRELRNVQTGEYVGLKDGRTLPIKFRVEDAALLTLTPPIIFSSDQSGNWDIWAVRPDGTGLTNLTDHPAYDEGARWSPDGSMIAFTTDRFSGNQDVAVLTLATGAVTQVTSGPAIEAPLDWSPDSEQLVIIQHDGDGDLYLVNVDGSGLTQLTSGSASDGPAQFTVDGARILFRSNPPGFANTNLFQIDADGSNQTLVLNWRFTDGIELSPDGSSLYVSGQEALGAPFDVYRLDLTSLALTRLTLDPSFDWHPTVSPTDQQLVFSSKRTGDWELHILDFATGAVSQLAPSAGTAETQSDWRR